MIPTLYAGDDLDFDTEVEDHSAADGWSLVYRLVPRSSAGTAIQITGIARGAAFNIRALSSVTAAWGPGVYTWRSWVIKGDERQTVGEGITEILADPATVAAGYDGRSHARICLDAIQAVIQNRATLDQEEVSIGGRSLKRTPLADLLKLRSAYIAEVGREVQAERLALGLDSGRRVYVRFQNAG